MRYLRLKILFCMWLVFAGVTTGMSWCLAGAPLIVTDAWIRFIAPGMKVHAGYFTLRNASPQLRVITAAESTSFASVELHRSRVVGGVATMELMHRIAVPAGGTVAFAPGGRHLMLTKPAGPVAEGGEVPIVLIFEDGQRFAFTASVRRGTGRGSHHGHAPGRPM